MDDQGMVSQQLDQVGQRAAQPHLIDSAPLRS